MKPKKKDNLTDAIEALQSHQDEGLKPQDDHRVMDNEGNLITLGQEGSNKAIRLSSSDLDAIAKVTKKAATSAIEKAARKYRK